jgi:predicted ATPase
MYICKVHIVNICCCKDLPVDFGQKGSSILISGDNGDGKSTVIRAIAMGLCDEASASALLREMSTNFVRAGKKIGTIEIELCDGPHRYKIKTEITVLKAFEGLKQTLFKIDKGKCEKVKPNDFPWNKIFVSAYGAGLRTGSMIQSEYTRYQAVDSVYPLFRYDVPLQDPELVFRRILDEAQKRGGKFADQIRKHIESLLKKLLNLDPPDKVRLSSNGIEIKRKGWEDWTGQSGLADGHQSAIIWFFDLVSWWLFYRKLLPQKHIFDTTKISGIVLIDEVEQHLHPKWQLEIMRLIKEIFPKIQFIASSHSPLVISGAKKIPVLTLYHGMQRYQKVYGWLAEDVYREVMQLPTSREDEMEKQIREYEELHLKSLQQKLSRKEKNKLASLKTILRALPASDPIMLLSELKNLSRKMETKKK